MELFLIALILLTIAFAGISVRIWLKNDDFRGTCSSNNSLNKDGNCSVCVKNNCEK